MAKISALGLALFCVVLVVSPITVRSNSRKEILLYATLIAGGPHANVILVAGPGPGPPTNATVFGAVIVVDIIPLKESLNSDSPQVGSLQGLYAVSSWNGDRVHVAESVINIIQRGKYKVGNLQVQGTLSVVGSGFAGELGVVSGTVAYRFMNGYVDVQTAQVFPATNTTILQLKFSIKEIDD